MPAEVADVSRAQVSWAALIAGLALVGCAHAPTPQEVLESIDTSGYALRSDTGRMYALADHRGRVWVLQFFSSWCVPCLAQVNQLEKLARREPDVGIVGVDFDLDARQTIRSFRATAHVTYPLLIADDDTRNGHSVFGRISVLPTTVIIDSQGVVRSAFSGLISDGDLDQLVTAARRPR